MATLQGRVAVVAGASRGAGKGIALALGDAGATVYVAGRSSRTGPAPVDGAPGTIEDTADEVTRRGGVGIPIRTDCTSEADVARLFDRVARDHQHLHVLANAVWGMAEVFPTMEAWMASFGKPFWEQPTASWRSMIGAGPEAYFLTSHYGARMMAHGSGGLIVGITDGYAGPDAAAAGDGAGDGQLLWRLAHDTINRLMSGMAREGKAHKVSVVTLMPGFMRTERVTRLLTTDTLRKQFGFDRSESTEYAGRAVVGLASDRRVARKSGTICFVADLAAEYGFTDVDGRRVPRFNPFG